MCDKIGKQCPQQNRKLIIHLFFYSHTFYLLILEKHIVNDVQSYNIVISLNVHRRETIKPDE